MNRLIIVGSPRVDGRCASLADLLFESCIAAYPDDEVALAPVSTLDVRGCSGCDGCKELARLREAAAEDGTEADGEGSAPLRRCVVDDDMAEIYELIDAADELVVVSPVYFAGAPAQLKALLDRLQPYFWTDARTRPKRPATLHVVGEGGDPHGFEPLVGVVRSALSCAGFALERVLDWVGKIDEDGEITAEAEEHPLTPLANVPRAEPQKEPQAAPVRSRDEAAAPAAAAAPRKPKLDLGANGSKPAAGKSGSRNQRGQSSKNKKHAHSKRSGGKNVG